MLGTVAAGQLVAQPPEVPRHAPLDISCLTCHGDAGDWGPDEQRFFISEESLADDVHRQAGVTCQDCHGGDPTAANPTGAHAAASGFRGPEEVENACGTCHRDAWVGVKQKGVHFKAGKKDETGRGSSMGCGVCHGKAHGMTPVDDSRSSVFLDNQVKTCGGCHEEEHRTYAESTHGHGLQASGLLVTAVCADCHGAHEIYRAADQRSTLHSSKIADTCAKCHAFIQERLQRSVHGRGSGLGGLADRTTPGGKGNREPSCNDCHQGHDLAHPEGIRFRQELPNRCGNCHTEVYGGYAASLHGEFTELGYGAAAKCSDCHGAHDILPADEPGSRLAAGNRQETCKQCHVYAVRNFCDFDPHANYKHAEEYPLLHAVHHWTKVPLNLAFGLFLAHAVLWFIRSFVHAMGNGRHKILTTQEEAYVRVQSVHRIVYLIMLICFLGLTLTGLPLKFGGQPWAHALARGLGGVETTGVWHRCFAVLVVCGCVLHVAWGVDRVIGRRKDKATWRSVILGPDSPLPGLRDVKDMFGMGRWFFGLGAKPVFERWTYWEKFDYWAVFLGTAVVGTSGLMLWYPNVFATILPGGALNVAKLLHADLALYVAGCIFMIHLFNTHMRPEKFPLDPSVITGLVSEEHLRSARPEYLERIQAAGKLDHVLRKVPSRRHVLIVKSVALLVLLTGVGLLALVLMASLGK